jgi:hypothetical protein
VQFYFVYNYICILAENCNNYLHLEISIANIGNDKSIAKMATGVLQLRCGDNISYAALPVSSRNTRLFAIIAN